MTEIRRGAPVLVALLLLFPPAPCAGQGPDTPPLFASGEPVDLTIQADMARLEDDRGSDPPERPATVIVAGADGAEVRLDAQLRTRGNFRRERSNCHMPPFRLNLKKGQVAGTVFAEQDKLKIVANCRPGRDAWAALVLREYLVYRILAAVTPDALRVRLARITWRDTSGETAPRTELAFFIEDADDLAARLGGSVFELDDDQNLPPAAFEPRSAMRLAIFQYMVGNTDWSETQGHNVEIVETDRGGIAIPYDFDFSGLVDAPYATPDPEVGIRSVRERRYLGWCRPTSLGSEILQEFRRARDEIRRTVVSFTYLDEGERDDIMDFLQPFHDDIETDRRAELTFLGLCRTMPGG